MRLPYVEMKLEDLLSKVEDRKKPKFRFNYGSRRKTVVTLPHLNFLDKSPLNTTKEN